MASRADRLQVVLELAEGAMNEAAEHFAKAREQLEGEKKQLEDLTLYCEDYQNQLAAASGQHSVDALVRSRGFLGQLLQAKRQQAQMTEHTQKIVNQKQTLWHKAHQKHRAMKELIDRLQADELLALSRKEEKMLDEWVTIDFSRKAQSGVQQFS